MSNPVIEYRSLLGALHRSGVEFIVIGGVAARLHGAERFTSDLDVLYRREPANYPRIAQALGAFDPYLRGAPPGLPFSLDEKTIASGGNFTLLTSEGAIDLLATIAGGDYETLLGHTELIDFGGFALRVLDLEMLIRVKRAAGRPKDFEAIAELERIAEEFGDA